MVSKQIPSLIISIFTFLVSCAISGTFGGFWSEREVRKLTGAKILGTNSNTVCIENGYRLILLTVRRPLPSALKARSLSHIILLTEEEKVCILKAWKTGSSPSFPISSPSAGLFENRPGAQSEPFLRDETRGAANQNSSSSAPVAPLALQCFQEEKKEREKTQ